MHLVFEIEDLERRYQFMKLLIDEDIGDVNKRNCLGLLPQEVEHAQPVRTIPKHL